MDKSVLEIVIKAENVHLDKFALIQAVKELSPEAYTADFFKIIDSRDFYSNVMNRIERMDKGRGAEIFSEAGLEGVYEKPELVFPTVEQAAEALQQLGDLLYKNSLAYHLEKDQMIKAEGEKKFYEKIFHYIFTKERK